MTAQLIGSIQTVQVIKQPSPARIVTGGQGPVGPVGPAGGVNSIATLTGNVAAADLRQAASLPTYVTTRTAGKALDPTKDTTILLGEGLRRGIFDSVLRSGLSANEQASVTADTSEGIYFISTANSLYAYRRRHDGVMNALWFGALGDNSNDDMPAFVAAYTMAKSIGSATTEGPCGHVWGPPGYRYKYGGPVGLDVPVKITVDGEIFYTPTTGAPYIVGVTLHTARGNTQYDIKLGVVRMVNGNTAAPTGINTAGACAVEIRDMQFSKLSVEFAIGFTHAGIWANATNNVFTGQQIQDNQIFLGEAAYNGVGFLAESHGAADGSFQANEVHCQDIFGNWCNIVLGKSGDSNTNNNLFFVSAADADTGGGNTILWSSYNFMQFGYINGTLTLQASTFYNRIYHQVGNAQCTVTDSGTGNLVQNNVEGTISQERWQTSGLAPLQVIQSTDAGAAVANLVDLYRNSASPAANDEGASLSFSFNNASAAKFIGVELESSLIATTAGGEYARARFFNRLGGVRTNVANLYQGLAIGATATDQGIGTLNVSGDYYVSASPLNPVPVTKTANFTVGLTDNQIIVSQAATTTVTLPAASSFLGRKIRIKTIQGQLVNSASSNVVPIGSSTAGTAILPATIGKWADLHSDGTNWVTMAGN